MPAACSTADSWRVCVSCWTHLLEQPNEPPVSSQRDVIAPKRERRGGKWIPNSNSAAVHGFSLCLLCSFSLLLSPRPKKRTLGANQSSSLAVPIVTSAAVCIDSWRLSVLEYNATRLIKCCTQIDLHWVNIPSFT